jgi:GNAT superfamily N-acetyltransferase
MTTRTTSENIDFQKLVQLLDAHLAILDGDEHAFFSQFNGLENLKNVVIYSYDNQVVGCGALKKIDSKTAEVKRMFVHPDFRGKAIASKILHELENWAIELNYNSLILETGTNNPTAIALYQKSGYNQIENYLQYKDVESSFCMQKNIDFR